MQINLAGRTALVTGSTAGIGRAIAEQLCEAGAQVIINGRTRSSVDRALEEIREEGFAGEAVGAVADVGTRAGCESLVAAIPALDILVNNAGLYAPLPFFETSDEDWLDCFQINMLSAVRLARAYLPGMLARGTGRLIFVSSDNALMAPPAAIHYSAAKASLLLISRSLAKLARGTSVTVNTILPGATMSRNVAAFVEGFAAEHGLTAGQGLDLFVKTQIPDSLVERGISTAEVANMVTYLCSPLASATTGASLRVDGGAINSIV